MRKTPLRLGLSLTLLVLCSFCAANANVYHVDLASNILQNASLDITTSGAAGPYPSGGVDITDISGGALLTYNSLVSAPVSLTGPIPNAAGVDNKLYGSLPYVDDQGVAFQAHFDDLFTFNFTIRAILLATGGFKFNVCTPDCVQANYSGTFDIISAQTPLPAALPFFATGLGAMGLLGWRRKRKVQAVA